MSEKHFLCSHRKTRNEPAVSHKEILKKLEEAKDFAPDELKKLQHLKVKIEVICDPIDLKMLVDQLKKLSYN